jgi:hypothetical protein
MAPDPSSPVPQPSANGTFKVVNTLTGTLIDLAQAASDDNNHTAAAEFMRQAGQKPGWQTTEFYLSVVTQLAGTALLSSGHAEIGALLMGVSALAYALSRGLAKKAPVRVGMLFLAATLALSGCSPAGYVRAEAIDGLVTRICDRHDAYVKADPSLAADKRGTYLDSSKVLRQVLAEAKKSTGVAPVGSK